MKGCRPRSSKFIPVRLIVLFVLLSFPLLWYAGRVTCRIHRLRQLEREDFSWLYYRNRINSENLGQQEQAPIEQQISTSAEFSFTSESFEVAVCEFQQEKHTLPASGADLLDFLLAGESPGELSRTKPYDALRKIGGAINPRTGHVYGSLKLKDWQPGGLFVESMAPQDPSPGVSFLYTIGLRQQARVAQIEQGKGLAWGDRKYPFLTDEFPPERVALSFRYGIFGSKPGEVLFDDVCIP